MSLYVYEMRRIARDAFEAGLTVGCGIREVVEDQRDEQEAESGEAGADLAARAAAFEAKRPQSDARALKNAADTIAAAAAIPGVFVFDGRVSSDIVITVKSGSTLLGERTASAVEPHGKWKGTDEGSDT